MEKDEETQTSISDQDCIKFLQFYVKEKIQLSKLIFCPEIFYGDLRENIDK